MTNFKTLAWVVTFCAVLAASRAHAQGFDSQQLRLVPNQKDNYFGLHSARTLHAGGFEAGLVLNYANDPLVIVDSDGDRVGSLVSDQLVGDVMFAFGVLDMLELGLDVPLVLVQRGDDVPGSGVSAADSGLGIGDVHLMAKLALWNRDTKQSPGGTAVALVLDAQLPTGSDSEFSGEAFRIEPRAVLDYAFPRSLRLSFQAGYLIRPKTEVLGVEVDDSLTLGLGADLPLDGAQRWHVIAETDAEISVLASSVDAEEVPLELLLGGRYVAANGLMIEAGGGFGLNEGFGTPDYRLLIGASYHTPEDLDPDGDGLFADADRCPEIAEDRDRFEDEDGCPDLDNDKDVIPDTSDRCALEPEDRDAFEDQDGCPDPDNDKDGLFDAADQCPIVAEDMDGFEDDDGCVDLDNDGDKLVDTEDGCPDQPEDADNFEDQDGCPDPDNDKDGLLDAADECVTEPEDFDGFEDDNGCPEQGSGLVKLTCEKIDIADRVYFDTGSDRIQQRSFGLLEQVASVLKSASYVRKMRVEGHTDDRGNDASNLELSARRAASVVRFLVEHGVADERLSSEGFGETKPIASNKTNKGRGENRRVEFVITEQDSRCASPE